MRKKIYKLESDEYNLTKLNREVLSDEDDEKIGVILSSTKNSAIAMLKIDKINGDLINIQNMYITISNPEWQKVQ